MPPEGASPEATRASASSTLASRQPRASAGVAVCRRPCDARSGHVMVRALTYVDGRGGRCDETALLELHHLDPHARGGPPTAANLTLRCKAHNALAAEQDFGRDFMQAKWAEQVARAPAPG